MNVVVCIICASVRASDSQSRVGQGLSCSSSKSNAVAWSIGVNRAPQTFGCLTKFLCRVCDYFAID